MKYKKGFVHITGKMGSKSKKREGGKKNLSPMVRKANDEFSGSAYAAKSLRHCMGERIKDFADRDLSSRLLKLTRKAITVGTGPYGQRGFHVGANSHLFKGLEADPCSPFRKWLRSQFTIAANLARNTLTLKVYPFQVNSGLRVPGSATHFRLVLVAGVLSDFGYTGQEKPYAPVHPELNERRVESWSRFCLLSSTCPGLELEAALPGVSVLPKTAGLVASLGIEFYIEVCGEMHPLVTGRALRVVDVY